MTDIPLVLLLGTLFTIQAHLAKALERQGIEVFAQIKARLQRSGEPIPGGLKKPLLYTIGLTLNNTLFIWSTLAQPHGPPALFSSLYGVGLVFLLLYAALVLRERISPRELVVAAGILLGTLVIGLENITAPPLDRFTMDLSTLLIALGIWLLLSLGFILLSLRLANLSLAALAFGLLAGGFGSLDPFFKGIGQNYGGTPGLLPSTSLGTLLFAASFLLGFLAFLVTQLGFARKVRLSLLVPAYNAAFIGLPVLWQTLLLPGYSPTAWTGLGLLLILSGVLAMQLPARTG